MAAPPPPIPAVPPGLQASALDIIKSALRLLNVLASGENPSGDEANDALLILNQLVDSWNAERLMVFAVERLVFGLVSGKQSYQMGVNAPDFAAARPARIDRASVIYNANAQQPLELPIEKLTDAGWQAIPVKSVQSALPQQFWDDNGFPFRTLSFWPIPNVAGLQVALYCWGQLQSFMTLVTQYQLPPAYMKALRYNLAVDLAPEFGRPLPPEVSAQAVVSKAVIKSLNIVPVSIACDLALAGQARGVYNWLDDNAGRA